MCIRLFTMLRQVTGCMSRVNRKMVQLQLVPINRRPDAAAPHPLVTETSEEEATGHRLEYQPQTLDEWKTVLAKDFLALKRLERSDAASRMRYAMKAQEIGQHCCQAGESLADTELSLLKQRLGLDEHQWRAYKSKVSPEPE